MLTVPKAQESKSKAPGEDLVWRCAFSCVLMVWKEIPSGAQCGTQGAFVYKCKSSVQEEAQVFVLTFFLLSISSFILMLVRIVPDHHQLL